MGMVVGINSTDEEVAESLMKSIRHTGYGQSDQRSIKIVQYYKPPGSYSGKKSSTRCHYIKYPPHKAPTKMRSND